MIIKIINELERNNTIRELCENMRVSSADIDDLVQEIYLILLEYDNEKVINMYNNKQLKFFLVGIIQRQYHSVTSPYYKKYKKYYSLIDANTINNSELNDDDLDD
jgi:hypothetical protein